MIDDIDPKVLWLKNMFIYYHISDGGTYDYNDHLMEQIKGINGINSDIYPWWYQFKTTKININKFIDLDYGYLLTLVNDASYFMDIDKSVWTPLFHHLWVNKYNVLDFNSFSVIEKKFPLTSFYYRVLNNIESHEIHSYFFKKYDGPNIFTLETMKYLVYYHNITDIPLIDIFIDKMTCISNIKGLSIILPIYKNLNKDGICLSNESYHDMIKNISSINDPFTIINMIMEYQLPLVGNQSLLTFLPESKFELVKFYEKIGIDIDKENMKMLISSLNNKSDGISFIDYYLSNHTDLNVGNLIMDYVKKDYLHLPYLMYKLIDRGVKLSWSSLYKINIIIRNLETTNENLITEDKDRLFKENTNLIIDNQQKIKRYHNIHILFRINDHDDLSDIKGIEKLSLPNITDCSIQFTSIINSYRKCQSNVAHYFLATSIEQYNKDVCPVCKCVMDPVIYYQ
jgi:hypothetical protein